MGTTKPRNQPGLQQEENFVRSPPQWACESQSLQPGSEPMVVKNRLWPSQSSGYCFRNPVVFLTAIDRTLSTSPLLLYLKVVTGLQGVNLPLLRNSHVPVSYLWALPPKYVNLTFQKLNWFFLTYPSHLHVGLMQKENSSRQIVCQRAGCSKDFQITARYAVGNLSPHGHNFPTFLMML